MNTGLLVIKLNHETDIACQVNHNYNKTVQRYILGHRKVYLDFFIVNINNIIHNGISLTLNPESEVKLTN